MLWALRGRFGSVYSEGVRPSWNCALPMAVVQECCRVRLSGVLARSVN
jgi:hypothetical protein